MKKIALMFFLSLMLYSCEKSYLIPSKEVPSWLKSKINKEEQIIKDSPQLMNSWGAWVRYEWHDQYFFEYHNPLSSSMPQPISLKGETLQIYATDMNTDYAKEKCCKTIVWQGPDYNDLSWME